MKKSLLLLSVVSVMILSCNKDDDPSPKTYNVTGLWIGTFKVDQLSIAALPYNYIIKPDGSMLTDGKGADGKTYYSAGTWTLDGDTLRSTYTTINFAGPAVTQSSKFYFNKSQGTLTNGTWKDGANGSNYTGTYPTMVRVN